MSQNEEHLDLLSIFHFVLGGLTALVSCVPLIHLTMGIFILVGDFETEGEDIPAFFGWLFIVFPSLIILTGWILSACIIRSGFRLRKRSSYTFCCVMAGIECIFFPLGTALGVFSLILLTKQEVKALFDPHGTDLPPVPPST